MDIDSYVNVIYDNLLKAKENGDKWVVTNIGKYSEPEQYYIFRSILNITRWFAETVRRSGEVITVYFKFADRCTH